MSNIWLAFITGLTTGGISCLAVQGGLLASAVSGNESKNTGAVWFLIGKLASYSLLGALLGSLGSALSLTPKVQGWMQIAAGIFMLATAARLLDLHPIFRKFVIQPPKSLMKIARNSSKMETAFSPILLGFATVLIPCGVTQAMMVVAISSANSLLGALIMAAFTIGTSPVFFVLGVATTEIFKRKKFAAAAAIVVATLGIISINTGQVLKGSGHTLQNYWTVITDSGDKSPEVKASVNNEGVQEVNINVLNNGYRSDTTILKKGVPVKLNLITRNTQGCSRSFTIPDYDVSVVLPATGEKTVEFTPTKTGRLLYSCSMGMYLGYFTVTG